MIHCPVCNESAVEPCLQIDSLPICCNVQYPSAEQARASGFAEMALAFCRHCGHLFNSAFDPAHIDYDPSYENSLHFSPRFQSYADDLARALVDRYGLKGSHIVEIACGKGDFLDALCAFGESRGTGYDPSYVPQRQGRASARIQVVRQYFNGNTAAEAVDLLCCRHALEHIPEPVSFLQAVGEGLAAGTPVFFEVPNALHMLRELAIWDLIYEHCGYFTPSSLTYAFGAAGYRSGEIAQVFGNQFLTIHAVSGGEGKRPSPGADVEESARLAGRFADRYRQKRALWRERLDSYREVGHKVAVWGAGSKGVTFLNAFGEEGEVEYLVDLNPHKQGLYCAGTGHRIVAPEALKAAPPEVVLVMNPIYTEEITQMLRALGIAADVVAV